MAFDFLKRSAVVLLLRGIREHQRRQADEMKRVADTLELIFKLQCIKQDVTPEYVKEAEPTVQEEEAAGVGETKLMDLIADQTPEELDRLDDAYDHAERRLGRGKVPESLDLFSYAESLRPESTEERP